VGCVLPGFWLLRLAPLDPLLTVAPVDFEARQKQEAAAVPDDRKTHEQRRNAELPLAVYVEELLQYNVYPASGPDWERFLGGIDRAASRQGTGGPGLFFRQDEEPVHNVLDKLSSGAGTTYISISRPGRDHHYRVDRRVWTRESFQTGAGFTGKPAPPAGMLYPFRTLGLAVILIGIALFALLPSPRRTGSGLSLSALEIAALAVGILLFAAPLVAIGGSVQALTRGTFLAIPCWALAALAVHFFVKPGVNAPDAPAAASANTSLFLREGIAFLTMAFGPIAFLVAASIALWNR
jgi:hypothetical protein